MYKCDAHLVVLERTYSLKTAEGWLLVMSGLGDRNDGEIYEDDENVTHIKHQAADFACCI